MPRGQRKGEFHSKDKRKLPIFIHSELDDYGLSCVEFRVYARIARRAGGDSTHSESIPNMALTFEVSEATVRRALQVLCLCNLIAEKKRPGWASEYTLNDKDKWRDKVELSSLRQSVLHPRSAIVTPTTIDRGKRDSPEHQQPGTGSTIDGRPLTPETDEGNPIKVIPEGTPDPSMRGAQKQGKPERANQEPKEPKTKCPANILETHPEIGGLFPQHNDRLKDIIFTWRENRLGQTRDTMRTEEQWYHDCLSWISREKVISRNGNGHNGANGKTNYSSQPSAGTAKGLGSQIDTSLTSRIKRAF